MSIKVLDPIIASRIAAGEVVDRPASVLRELLDNSIDSKATTIKVYITEGGISNITVVDNGCGMSKEDLELACKSHATSKIKTLDDLFALKTLGFRGEALCSIAAVSKTTISSNGYSVINDNGNQSDVMHSSTDKGTVVSVDGIFENIPARKQFLKRPSTEALECRKVFIEKILGACEISFQFFQDGKLELNTPASDKKTRILTVMQLDRSFVSVDSIDMSYTAEPVNLYAVASSPSCYKRDRSQIKIFVNNRVIDCFPLVQAITTSYSVSLPGGAFPFFYLFIEDSPSMLDFNIHPTKRECKIRNQSTIYGMITKMIRERLLALNRNQSVIEKQTTELPDEDFSELLSIKEEEPKFTKPFAYTNASAQSSRVVSDNERKLDPSFFEIARKALSIKPDKPLAKEREYTYIGQAFNTFLIVEKDDRLLFIDQHAAHERILYDKIRNNPDKQLLAVPYEFETESDVDEFLVENSVIYEDFGVQLVRTGKCMWEMISIPAACRKNESDIVRYIKSATGDIQEAQKGLFAVIACHSAIKAGDIVDTNTALSLLDNVFELDAMLCPHGRSFVYEISKQSLYKEVGRLI